MEGNILENAPKLPDNEVFAQETQGLAQEMAGLNNRYEILYNGEYVDRAAFGILVRDFIILKEKSQTTSLENLPTDRAREYVQSLPQLCDLLIQNLQERMEGT